MRRRFVRRIGLGLAFFFLLVFGASALAVTLVTGAFGVERQRGQILVAGIIGLILLFLGAVAVVRSIRRMAAPLGDVMEAAERVSGGDYEVRVRERGPREMRRLARSFNEMASRLGDSERQRRDLLADVAHELRTPLSVIRGDLEAIVDGVYPADRGHLVPVLEEARVMARLLEDLRTISTAEAGALRLHRETTAPERLVEDAVAAFRGRAEAAGVRLETLVADGVPALDVDPVRIGQVLGNLVTNAIEHTPSGGSVGVAVRPDADGRVAFEVRDTGSGIPPEDLPRIFDRFQRSPRSRGAGLGLAIARTLVEAHGGTIEAASEPGCGTTVRVVLPS
jgi:two-component system OmpR family sensor kinase/two-component system sensor histidine kinase BaeS